METTECAGNEGNLNFNLKDYSTKAEVLAAVDRIRYRRQNTNMTGGLKVARLEVFGGNDKRPNVSRIIVLITDGVPTRDAEKLDDEVAEIRKMGIRIIGLGITNKVCQYEVCKGSLFSTPTHSRTPVALRAARSRHCHSSGKIKPGPCYVGPMLNGIPLQSVVLEESGEKLKIVRRI